MEIVDVYWDLENVGVPNYLKFTRVLEHMEDAIAGEGGQMGNVYIYGESRLFAQLDVLSDADPVTGYCRIKGIKGIRVYGYLFYVDPRSKLKRKSDEADKRIIVDIFKHIFDRKKQVSCRGVCIVSSDGDFSYTLWTVRQMGVPVYLVYGKQAPQDLIGVVPPDRAFRWDDVCRGLPSTVKGDETNHTRRDVTVAIARMIQDRVLIDDVMVRVYMGIGRCYGYWSNIAKETFFVDSVKRGETFQKILEKKGHKFYDVRNESLSSLPFGHLEKLCGVLYRNRGVVVKGGFYQMSELILAELGPDRSEFSVGEMGVFVRRCVAYGLIARRPKVIQIHEDVPETIPFDKLVEATSVPARHVALDTAKTAMQWYMQKFFKIKPQYDLQIAGLEHKRSFATYLKVPLLSGSWFYVKASGKNKVDAEKQAAREGMRCLLNKYEPKLRLPNHMIPDYIPSRPLPKPSQVPLSKARNALSWYVSQVNGGGRKAASETLRTGKIHKPLYVCTVTVPHHSGLDSTVVGTGPTKSHAEMVAVYNAVRNIQGEGHEAGLVFPEKHTTDADQIGRCCLWLEKHVNFFFDGSTISHTTEEKDGDIHRYRTTTVVELPHMSIIGHGLSGDEQRSKSLACARCLESIIVHNGEVDYNDSSSSSSDSDSSTISINSDTISINSDSSSISSDSDTDTISISDSSNINSDTSSTINSDSDTDTVSVSDSSSSNTTSM